jgi:hypothetical protein
MYSPSSSKYKFFTKRNLNLTKLHRKYFLSQLKKNTNYFF